MDFEVGLFNMKWITSSWTDTVTWFPVCSINSSRFNTTE